ncbi:MAG: hypothetical protein ACO3JL_14030, partial [Myxococcota bacterium]
MTPPWSLLLVSALVLYGVATTLYVAHLLSRKPVLAVLAGRALFAGLALHGTGKVAGYWLTGGLPVATSTEVLNLLALVIGFV